MKLQADSQGRIESSDLFPPLAVFDAERQADGSVRLIEVNSGAVPVLSPQRVNGRLRGAAVALDHATVAAAVRAERDSR